MSPKAWVLQRACPANALCSTAGTLVQSVVPNGILLIFIGMFSIVHAARHLFHDIKQRDNAGSFNRSAMEPPIPRDPAIE